MPGHNSAHHEMIRSLTSELVEIHGFTAHDMRENPVTFDVVRAVLDAGDPVEGWAVAYYMTGNRLHLPVEIAFEGIDRRDGHVDDDYLATLGQQATDEHVVLVEDAARVVPVSQMRAA